MQIQKKSGHNKLLIIVASLAVAGTLIGSYFLLFGNNDKDLSTEPQTNQQPSKTSEDSSDSSNDSAIDTANPEDRDKPGITDQSSNPSNEPKRTITVFITDASQYGDLVEVRSYVNEVASNGKCSLVFTKGNLTLKRTTDILPTASTSSCKTVQIPVSSFAEKGTWRLTINYSSNSGTGISEEKPVTIK